MLKFGKYTSAGVDSFQVFAYLKEKGDFIMGPNPTIHDLKIERNKEQKRDFIISFVALLLFLFLFTICGLYNFGIALLFLFFIAPVLILFGVQFYEQSVTPTKEQLTEYNRRNNPFLMTIDEEKE